MDCLQSFSLLDYLSLHLKAEEQEHGDMEQVNFQVDARLDLRQNVLVLDLIYPTTCLIFIVAFNAGWIRSFIADYGVPLMVVLWTALSYGMPGKVPDGVPRRLFCPLPWESASLYHWTVVKVLLST